MCPVFSLKKKPPEPRHSLSVRLFGVQIDGEGLGGVFVVPLVLLIIVAAGSTFVGGVAWFARMFPQSAVMQTPDDAPPKD